MPEKFTIPASSQEKEPSFKELAADFENKYPLAELMEIKELSPQLHDWFFYAEQLNSTESYEKTVKTLEKHGVEGAAETYKEKIMMVRSSVLSAEDQRRLDLRTGALGALPQIYKKLDQNNEEEKSKYIEISKAVGIFDNTNSRINHSREATFKKY